MVHYLAVLEKQEELLTSSLACLMKLTGLDSLLYHKADCWTYAQRKISSTMRYEHY